MSQDAYSVSELARLAGVSVRTLHHYDQIGLLHPAERSAGGYRRYERAELLRLQQILFYRELDVPLAEIRRSLDDPGFDPLETLKRQRNALRARAERTRRLLQTVSETIRSMQGERPMLTTSELYDGLAQETIEAYENEVKNQWPEEHSAVNEKIRSMTKEQWTTIQRERDAIAAACAELARNPSNNPAGEEALALAVRQKAWLENFYPVDAARMRGLAEMYVSDARFAAHYDAFGDGTAALLAAAMRELASRG